MSLTNGNWNAGDSSGEGLSQYSANQLFTAGYIRLLRERFVGNWLNGTGTHQPGHGIAERRPVGLGQHDLHRRHRRGRLRPWRWRSSQLRLRGGLHLLPDRTAWLHYQPGDQQLLRRPGELLSHPDRRQLRPVPDLSPGWSPASIQPARPPVLPGANPDNPFPIAEVQFYDQKNTFGQDETQDIIDNSGRTGIEAFWVVIDGFSKQSFQSLGIQVGSFTGSFAALPGVTITRQPARRPVRERRQRTTPQQHPHPVRHHALSTADPEPVPLHRRLLALQPDGLAHLERHDSDGLAGEHRIRADRRGRPLFHQHRRRARTTSPISARTCGCSRPRRRSKHAVPRRPGLRAPTASTAPTATSRRCSATSTATSSFTNPSGIDPFSLLPDQQGEGQTDTSVAPFAFNFADPLLPTIANNYNFAIARVRLRGTSGPSGAAKMCGSSSACSERRATTPTSIRTGPIPRSRDAAGHPGTPAARRWRHHHSVLRHRQSRQPRPTTRPAARTSRP